MPSEPSGHKNRSALCDIRDNALLAREFQQSGRFIISLRLVTPQFL
jgi:hypothetical protein